MLLWRFPVWLGWFSHSSENMLRQICNKWGRVRTYWAKKWGLTWKSFFTILRKPDLHAYELKFLIRSINIQEFFPRCSPRKMVIKLRQLIRCDPTGRMFRNGASEYGNKARGTHGLAEHVMTSWWVQDESTVGKIVKEKKVT